MSEESVRRGEHTRAAIVKAAHELFVQQGYHGTSMRQIAAKAGLALGGLYNHFPSKEEVFKEVFLEYHPYHEVLPIMMEARGENIEQFVRDAFARVVEVLNNRPGFMNLMFIETVEFNGAHMRELFQALLPQAFLIIQSIQQTNREQMRDIPPFVIIRTFLGMMIAYYITEMVLAPAAPAEYYQEARHYFESIYLYGILKQPEPGAPCKEA